MSGEVDTHNVRIWGAKNSHEAREMFRNREKETIRCALSVNEFTELYYFEDPIVDGKSNLSLLSQYFLPMMPIFSENTMFQQIGPLEP